MFTAPTRPLTRIRKHIRPAAVVGAVLAASLLSACSSGASGSTTGGTQLVGLRVAAPATAVVGLSPELTGPAGWAIHEGKAKAILAKYGYQYNGLAAFSNGPPAAQALASGSVQLAQLGDAPAVLSRGSGQDNRAILLADQPGMTWIVARDGVADDLAALKGKKIGVQFGSDFDHYLRYALGKAGISDDVTLVNMVMADGYAALQRGSIDAYAAIDGIAAVWQQKGGVQVIEKAEQANPSYKDANVTLVTSSFLKAHPNIQQAWWAVYKEGVGLIEQDPEAFLEWTAKQSGESVGIAKQTTSLDYPDGPVTDAAVQAVSATAQFLVSQQLTKAYSIADWAVQPGTGGGR
jgi:ABC-type nitrate/sulfonate/bicarbonate transport system substrate-binding protein